MSALRGLRLPGHKQRPFETPLRVLPPPPVAVLALDQGSGESAIPVVVAGARVRMGTVVAAASGAAAALHSPVSGTVREIAPCPTLDGLAPCIVVESDGLDEPESALAAVDWTALGGPSLIARIGAAGIAGLGGAAFPTAAKLAAARAGGVELLLLNGAECEPWICCDDALLRDRAAEVVLGARIMLAACGARRCVVAIEEDKPQAIDALRSALATTDDERIELLALPALFPLGAEGPLVTAVTGREVPRDGLPPQVGVLCQNVATAAAVARLVEQGMPLVSRIVTVTGGGVRRPANCEARIGTPVSTLIDACGGRGDSPSRLVAGGSLTGCGFDDDRVPLTKGFNCLLVATADDLPARGPEMPCIRCGDCATVCPAGLLPQQLYLSARADDDAGLRRFGLDACIECGCCDYVCPSAIPLTGTFRAARGRRQLREAGRLRALDARLRYERHERRLAAQAEAERRAFDEARNRARGTDA